MYNITYVKALEIWAVIDNNDKVVVYSESREEAFDTMRHMNENL